MLDEQHLDAAEHVKLFKSTLQSYGKSIDNIVVIIGHNCSTNNKIVDIMEHPLIGCFSHKFNLAIKKWIEEQMGLCNAILKLWQM